MTPIGIKMTLDGQREVSQGLKQVGNDVNALGNAGGKLGVLGQGMDKAALSAGQLRMATQQLPLQFQDIVVSLQAGQQPLTVFLQQGSQIAGSFGGASAAAKAMLGYVTSLITPMTVLGAGVAAVGVAYYQGSKEQDAWVRGMVTTGNASGITTSQLRDYARAIDGVVGTQREAAAGLAEFVQAGVRGGDELRRYTESAVMWEKATGQAVSTTAKQFSDLQKDPLAAVIKLNEGTNFLTASVYEQVKALSEQGNKADASRVAMDALESTMRDRAKQIEESLGYLERGWRAVAGAASDGWDAMLGVGRKQTNRDILAGLQAQLDSRMSRSDVLGNDEALEKGNAKLRARIQAVQDLILQEDIHATSQAQSAKATQDLIAFDSKYSKALENELSLKQKQERARAEAVAVGKSEADIIKVLTYVTEEHNKSLSKGGAAAKAAKTSYESLISTINQKIVALQTEATTGDKLTETEKLRAKYQEELTTKGRQYTAAQREQLEARLRVLEVEETQALTQRELIKSQEEGVKAYDRLKSARERSLETLQQTVRTARDEEQAAALATASNITQAEALSRLAAARAEDAYMQALANGEAPATLDFLEREMQARRELIELMGQKGVREANSKAAKDAAREWEKVSQTIGDTLADYIMSGGKDAATYLKRLFSTLVLQPVVQTAVGSIFGMGNTSSGGLQGNSSGGAGSLLGGVQNLQSIYSAFSGGLVSSIGGAIGTLGSTFGSSALTSFAAGMKGASLAAGLAGPTTAGAGGLMGAGAGFAAALPWLAGGLAVVSLLGGLTKEVTPHAGAASIYRNGAASGNAATAQGLVNAGDSYIAAMQAPLNNLALIVGSSFDSLAKEYGKKSGYVVGTGFTSDNNDPSSGYFQLSNPEGESLSRWTISRRDPKYTSRGTTGYSSDSAKGYDEYLKDVALASLGSILDIVPDWADDMARSVTASLGNASGKDAMQAFSDLVEQIFAIEAAFTSLGEVMPMFADITDDVKTTLIKASGSFDALNANAQSFYANFYTAEEKLQNRVNSLQEVFLEYGAELPTTAEQYRALVEQQMAAGDAGAEFAAVLLGLNGAFKEVADVWKTELDSMSSSVASFFGDLHGQIQSVSDAVASDRKSILRGNDVMSSEAIAAAIAGTAIMSPSLAGVTAAGSAADIARDLVQQRKAGADTAQGGADEQQKKLDAAKAARDSVADRLSAADARIAYLKWDSSRLWDGGSKSGYSLSKRNKWQRDIDAAMANQVTLREQLQAQLQPLEGDVTQQQAVYDEFVAAAKAAAEKLAEAQKALADASKAQEQAKVDYASDVAQWVIDAEGSVSKLSDLRGEVVSFYEAQAQAVQAMLQSAGNIRGVADQVRLSQLSTAQTAQELGARYAMDYSMALSTTGSMRAGYVDSMAGNLQGLSNAMKAEASSSAEWQINVAKLLAQASNAAGLLEGDVKADDYQDVALGLLGSIDTALEGLSTATKSAEQVIAEAIAAGTQAQLEGLRAIVAALKGEAVPGFASGGLHLGGLRIVGENGPELEATGPSRIWNAQQLSSALGGAGMDSASGVKALLHEVQLSRIQTQAHSLAIIELLEPLLRLAMRWEVLGTPGPRPEEEVAA